MYQKHGLYSTRRGSSTCDITVFVKFLISIVKFGILALPSYFFMQPELTMYFDESGGAGQDWDVDLTKDAFT